MNAVDIVAVGERLKVLQLTIQEISERLQSATLDPGTVQTANAAVTEVANLTSALVNSPTVATAVRIAESTASVDEYREAINRANEASQMLRQTVHESLVGALETKSR